MARPNADADVFTAVADPTRRRILDLLAAGRADVSTLVGAFEISQPSISKHLQVLRAAGLVDVRQDGRRRLYDLRLQPLLALARWLSQHVGSARRGGAAPEGQPASRPTPTPLPVTRRRARPAAGLEMEVD